MSKAAVKFESLVCLLLIALLGNMVGCSDSENRLYRYSGGGASSDLVRLDITPKKARVPQGMTVQLQALGTYKDGTTSDITNRVTWSSADITIASVKDGLVSGASLGETQIGASAEGGLSAYVSVTVSDAVPLGYSVDAGGHEIQDVLPIISGASEPLHVIAQMSDGTSADITSEIKWVCEPEGIVSVDADGHITALKPGTATVKAISSDGQVVAQFQTVVSAPELVSLNLDRAVLQLLPNTSEAIEATAGYGDGTSVNVNGKVKWFSSDTSVASVSVEENGGAQPKAIIRGLKAGKATITAVFGEFSSSCAVEVQEATLVSIAFTQDGIEVIAGLTSALSVEGTYSDGSSRDVTASCLFSTSNASVAIVESEGSSVPGRVHGLACR
ncbi:MAG: Ig-like domain-containing protein [bacterium]|nr:Ig-like domain-containing protein [bacterium]